MNKEFADETLMSDIVTAIHRRQRRYKFILNPSDIRKATNKAMKIVVKENLELSK